MYCYSKHTKEYILYRNIIKRCYDDSNKIYKNVVVDERWLNFQNFCKDIQELENYNDWKNDNSKRNKWEIDKDILCEKLNIQPKKYSKDTCMFILKKDNMSEMNKRTKITGLTYIAVRLEDGYKETFFNQREFARKWDLKQSGISACIRNKSNKYKGWMFYILR